MFHFIHAPLLSLAMAGLGMAQSVPFSTGEWEPFTSEKLPNMGCATELVAAICKAGGIEASFHFYPWIRAERMVVSGEAFCAFPYVMNDTRKRQFDFSDPLFYGVNKFVYYAGSGAFREPKVAALVDLKPYRVAVLRGSFLEEDLRKAGIGIEIVNSLDSAARMLHSGRVDFMVDEETAVFHALQACFPGESGRFRALPNVFWGSTASYLIVSRDYPNARAILARFNRGLRAIKKNGVYRRITANYHMNTE